MLSTIATLQTFKAQRTTLSTAIRLHEVTGEKQLELSGMSGRKI